MNPVLVVHGGAWAIPDDMVEAHLNGVRNALAAGWRVLEREDRLSKRSRRPSSFSKTTRPSMRDAGAS